MKQLTNSGGFTTKFFEEAEKLKLTAEALYSQQKIARAELFKLVLTEDVQKNITDAASKTSITKYSATKIA